MANVSLTKENIKYIRDAFWHFFPEDAVYSADKPYVSGEFNWENRRSFIDFVYRLTGVQIKSEKDFQNIKKAELAVEELVETGEKKPDSNIQTKEQRELAEKERQEREASQKKAVADAKIQVEAAIKKQKEIYAEQIQKAKGVETSLKNQKIYYKVEKVPVEETLEIVNLKQQAGADPKKFIEDATNQFKANPNLKNLTANEARVVSQQAAVTTYDVLTDNSPVVQIAVINKIVSDPALLNKIVPDLEHQKALKDFASVLMEQKRAQFELAGQFADISKIDGIISPENVTVEISETPKDGFKEFDLNQQIVTPHLDNLSQQNLLLDNLTGFGEREIKSQILLGVGNRLESYVAKLPTNSLLAKTYNSEIVQLGLSSIGIVEAVPWVAVEGSLFGKIVVGSGFGSVAGFIQAKTGINLGIKLATEAATKVAVSTGTKVATGAITGTGLAAGITAAFAWTGPLAPIIGAVGAFLVNVVGAKVISKVVGWVKDNAQKYGKYIVGLVGAGFGLILGGGSILGAIAGGVVGYGGAAVISGGVSGLGASFTSLGSGIVGFFGALGGAFLGAIGMPILVTLLVFPVVVALILFIINSGAYLVPPTTSGFMMTNPYIGIEKVANLPGPFNNSDIPNKTNIEYTVTVSAKKGQLTNIVFKDECKVIKKGSSPSCPSPSQETPVPPNSISPASPFTFKYSVNFNSHNFDDSVTINTLTVTADTADEKGVTSEGSAAIIMGNPPTACFIFDNSWSAGGKAQILEAIAQMSQATTYMTTLCQAWNEKIPLSFSGDPEPYAGYFTGNGILLYPYALSYGLNGTLYTLAHESGHAYAARVPGIWSLFDHTSGLTEKICTYLPSYHPHSEDFAEMIGLYISKKPNVSNGCLSNFKTQYSNYWQFAHDHIFFQNLGW